MADGRDRCLVLCEPGHNPNVQIRLFPNEYGIQDELSDGVIPSYVIFAKLYQHLMLLGVIIILLGFTGYLPTLYILQLPYYVAATVLLLFSLGLITSTLSTIIRDVHNIIVSLMKVMFYLTPILWVMDAKEHPTIVNIMKLNPLYYIVEGYRASLLGNHGI